MTSTPVKNVGVLMNLAGTRAAAAAGNMASQTGSFGDVMNKASEGANNQSSQIKTDTAKNKDLSSAQTDKPHTHKEPPKAEDVKKTEEAAVTGKQEQAVQEAGKELVKEIADKMGVSEEEVVRVMEQLGLSMASLLDAENLTKLALTLSGTDNPLALLTDESLYGTIKDLLQSLSEIKDGLGEDLSLNQEEMAQLLETMKEETKVQQEGPNQSNPLLPEGDVSAEAEGEMTEAKIIVTVEQNGERIQLSADKNGNAEQVETVVPDENAQMSGETAGKQGSESKGSKNQGEGNPQIGNPLLDALLQNKAPAQQVSFEQTAGLFSQDTQEIMNQILDYMKIQLKPGLDQLEMQLHPASLGSVHIQIASKGGEITAQFHVQNEAVKAAIEGQIVELKDSLREQGVKVEAVEVTVESHAFEQNLWQGQEDGASAGGQGQKRSTRRINLNELDGLPEEDAGEEEQLTAKMMAANGNTVDYTA